MNVMVQGRARVTIPTTEVPTMTFSKGVQECLQYLGTVRGYSPATVRNYERTSNQFLAYLLSQGHQDACASMTTDTVMGFCAHLGAHGAAPNTILNKLHGLSTIARYLMKRKDGRGRPLLVGNPTLGFDRPRETRAETKFLLPGELAQFLALPLDPYLDVARALLVDTGIRRLEAVEASVGDLKDVGGTIYLTLRVKGRRGAGEQPASVPLSEPCAAQVIEWLRSRGPLKPTDPLLVDRRGRRWTDSQLTTAFIRLGLRAGLTRLTTSPHKLRHTANVIARQSGVDPLTRAAMLNHRSLKTLARYDHLVPGETAKGRAAQRAGMAKYLLQGLGTPPCEATLRDGPDSSTSNSADL